MIRFVFVLCSAFALMTAPGCKSDPPPRAEATPTSAPSAAQAAPVSRVTDRRDLMEQIRWCDVRHRGIAIDASSEWAETHRGFVVGPFEDLVPNEREAPAAVKSASLSFDFWLDRAASDVFIELRARGQLATQLVVDVDNLRLGEQRLSRTEGKVLRFGPVPRELSAGRHQLTLRFRARQRADVATRAWLEWIRVYISDNHAGAYVAPTRQNLLQDVVLDGEPRRGIALRAPGSVRCPVFVPNHTRLKLELGHWGSGSGVAQVSVSTQDGRRIVLAEHEVSSQEEKGSWLPLELTLDAFAQQLVALEFSAVEAPEGGRIVFAEPELTLEKLATPALDAKNVIVIVLGGLGRTSLPPHVDRHRLPHLYQLSERGVVFDGYRASSTVVNSVLATVLSGKRPVEHQVLDPAARIPESLELSSQRMRRSGGMSAFFTNVPYSFAAFGFDQGWHQFEQISPTEDVPATEPLRAGRKWLEGWLPKRDPAPRFLLVHLSAAHPPWDVTLEESALLAPKDYSGMIDPRRAAVVLSDLRSGARRRGLSAQDWVRLSALQETALKKVDVSVGALMEVLERSGRWDDTLLIVMGDVAMGDAPNLPFAPLGLLEEGRLAVPLIAKLPGSKASPRAQHRFGSEVIARTLQEALGLPWLGSDLVPTLGAIAHDQVGLHPSSGMLATQGHRFAFHLGPYRLSGDLARTPTICDLEVDPTCQHDLLPEQPFLAQWLWRAFLAAREDQALRAPQRPDQTNPSEPLRRQAAEIDPATRSALEVYGL